MRVYYSSIDQKLAYIKSWPTFCEKKYYHLNAQFSKVYYFYCTSTSLKNTVVSNHPSVANHFSEIQ